MSQSRRVLTLGVALLAGISTVSPVMAQTKEPAQTNTPATARSNAGARHVVNGEVTEVDADRGWVNIKTSEGRMKLHFPSNVLQNVKVGDRVSVEVALTAP
jgi:ribosomal protein S1